MRRHWWRILVVLAVAVLLWLPRGLGLDRYTTADEHAWLTRSANFYWALSRGDWAETFQRHHPGVTLTWAGTFGFLTTYPSYVNDTDRTFGWLTEELTPFLREHGHEPAELLAAGRGVAVILIVLALTLSFVLLWRGWGLWPALAGMLLLAFDPFHVAHARLMHLDGLLSSFMLLSVVALVVALDPAEKPRWQRGALIVAGIATGLAWLTRSPGLFLIPFMLLMGIVVWLRRYRHSARLAIEEGVQASLFTRDLRATTIFLLTTFIGWSVIAAFTFVLLWPAMWVNPLQTIGAVWNAANTYATEGHADPTFFNGTIHNGDPGFWFYPITFLWRTTPIVLAGMVLALVGLILPQLRRDRFPAVKKSVIILFVAFALLFTLLMNLGAKKFDRYLLPIYPLFDLVAGLGFVTIAKWLWQTQHQRWQRIGAVLSILLALVLQVALTLPHHPYYLTYYNPLLGGTSAAANVMQIGRGEGANLAAQSLNQHIASSQQPTATTASSFPNGPFSYFFHGRTVPPAFWTLADYAVVYPQDWQRQLPSARQMTWIEQLTPLETIRLHGLDYARIYDLRDAPTPTFVTTWGAGDEAQICLNAYELTAGSVMPGDTVRATLYLENLAPIAADLNVLVRLVDQDGNEIAREEGWPWGAATSSWPIGEIWPDGHTLTIPPATPNGLYRLEVGFYDPANQALLPASQPRTGEPLPALVPLDTLQVGRVAQQPALAVGEPYRVGDVAMLIGYTTLTSAGRQIDVGRVPLLPGEDLNVTLFWRALKGTEIDYSVFVHVVDSNGQLLTQHDGYPMNGFLPTSLWHRNQVVVDPYTLTIPAGANLGEYSIFVGLYDLQTATRLPVQQGDMAMGDSIPLTRLVVALSRTEELQPSE